MFKFFKSKNVIVVIIEVLIIIGILASFTYAIYNISSNLILKTNKISIDTDVFGDTYIDSDNVKLMPINDEDVINNNDNVLRIEFNVRGNENNIVNNVIYDVALTDLYIDCELVSEYLKWQLYKNGVSLSSGNFSNEFDTIIDNRLVLTNIQEDLVSYSNEADHYEFVLWISDSCQEDDISRCSSSANQSNLLNKSISGKLEIELYTGSKKELIRNPGGESFCVNNLDKSGANKPVTYDELIPVYYDDDNGVWRKADSYNNDSNYKWYDYDKMMWANAVIVNNKEDYDDIKLGSIINNKDIVAFYVWIPRYMYQVWNINGDDNLSNNYKDGINIKFENGYNDDGNITCTSDKCVGNNLEWLTHPIFTMKNIKGFWVGKYLTGGSKENPLIIDNSDVLLNYTKELALSTSLNLFNNNVNKFKVELFSNLEWGSVSYLLYSKYGIDDNNINKYLVYGIDDSNYEMVINDYNILGSATYEVGNIFDSKNEVIYRNNLFDYNINSSSYGFRSILY